MDGAQHYDQFVAPFLEPYTVATIAAVPSDAIDVLDHGAGTGAVTRALLARRADRSVTALDPSGEMLARIPDKLDATEAARLSVISGTISEVAFETRFDAITSQVALAFCRDIPSELAALRRHAKVGATIAIASLGPPETLAAFTFYWEAARRVHPELAPAGDYPHFRTADPSVLAHTLTEAGWQVDGSAVIESWRTLSPDDLWTWVSRALPLRAPTGTVLDLAVPQWDAIRTELDLALPPTDDNGVITIPMHGWLVRAHH